MNVTIYTQRIVSVSEYPTYRAIKRTEYTAYLDGYCIEVHNKDEACRLARQSARQQGYTGRVSFTFLPKPVDRPVCRMDGVIRPCTWHPDRTQVSA